MINIEIVSDNNLWNKKIKKKIIFFNILKKLFPKKYRFIKKKKKNHFFQYLNKTFPKEI